MIVVGVDLSGPSNPRDTAVVVTRPRESRLAVVAIHAGVGDDALVALIEALPDDDLVVGLDAPLSYEPGGGDRAADRALRARAREAGLPSGTVMSPTMTRMAYLTLRGLSVARLVEAVRPATRVVEVHPATALALRGAPVEDVRAWKPSAPARTRLHAWLEANLLEGLPAAAADTDHLLAASAAACAAYDWARGAAVWSHPAHPPLHPHDVCA